MNRNHLLATMTAAAIAIGSAAALASPGDRAERHRMDFETLDADGDDRLTRDELFAPAMERFAEADANSDGTVSLEELTAHAQARAAERAAAMLERLDTDKDGALSEAEMRHPDRADRMFARLDADGDGAISKAEFDEARSKMRHFRDRHHD